MAGLQTQILNVLAAGGAMPALQIAKLCQLKTKKDVNSTLYAMDGQGLLRIFKESNPPKFQLIGAVPLPSALANGERQNGSTAGHMPEVSSATGNRHALAPALAPPVATTASVSSTVQSRCNVSTGHKSSQGQELAAPLQCKKVEHSRKPFCVFQNEDTDNGRSDACASPDAPCLPHWFQLEALEKVKEHNTIVHLPTGKGKTLIAALAIDFFLSDRPRQVVAFVVPTCALIAQQARYCRDHCRTPVHVEELNSVGDHKGTWEGFLQKRCVLVGTPESFRHAMVDNSCLPVECLSLLVLDECHHATGNSPMAQLLLDAVLRQKPECRPRILGLTASFVNGAMKDPVGRREQLELLLDASFFCPLDVELSKSAQSCQHVLWENEETLDLLIACLKTNQECILNAALDNTTCVDSVSLDRLKLESCSNAFNETLSLPALILEDNGTLLLPGDPIDRFERAASPLRGDVETSARSVALLKLLHRLLSVHQDDPSYKGVIFVTRVSMAPSLAELISQYLVLTSPGRLGFPVSVGVVTGTGSMSNHQREDTLLAFRQGSTRLLVSTSALEEGLNVPDCGLVIRFDKFDTSKNHIQGSGRARLDNADVYYLCNDPVIEQERAKQMLEVASSSEYGLTQQERAKLHAHQFAKDIPGVHPFLGPEDRETGSAELNFFNALPIVYTYEQKVRCALGMKSSFSPDDILVYAKDADGRAAHIASVSYPTHQGDQHVTLDEVNAHWRDVDVHDVLLPERCKRMSEKDIHKRRFLFVVAVSMRCRGHLTAQNRPSSLALYGATSNEKRQAYAACPATSPSPSEDVPGRASSSSLLGCRSVCLVHGAQKKVMRLPARMTVAEMLQKYRPSAFAGDAELAVDGEVQDTELRVIDLPGPRNVVTAEIREAEEW